MILTNYLLPATVAKIEIQIFSFIQKFYPTSLIYKNIVQMYILYKTKKKLCHRQFKTKMPSTGNIFLVNTKRIKKETK